jgi:hypothetical protein
MSSSLTHEDALCEKGWRVMSLFCDILFQIVLVFIFYLAIASPIFTLHSGLFISSRSLSFSPRRLSIRDRQRK